MKEKEKSPSERGTYSAEEIEDLTRILKYVKKRLIKEDSQNESYPENYRKRMRFLYERTFNKVIEILENQVK